MDPKRPTPRHVIIKMAKVKERFLNVSREKQRHIEENSYKSIHRFFCRNLQVRRECPDIFKVLKRQNLQPRIICPAKLSFRIEGGIKSFSDKKELKDFIILK